MSAMMRGMEMQELTNEELEGVGGGGNAKDCANAMLFWGGVGAGLGSIGGGYLGFFAGAAIGGGLAAHYTTVCQK
ncbi:hypothetical protein [Hyalangium versicolor]|uniref:hypothetical protein n=1 Tax=Hyalangium versicolor TaxID=2861190 RepID=UPI001CCABED2|nr:hypothetical protein [Hyalangium versicolor]